MGVRLMVEVLDHAPKDLQPREVLALLAIAESANDATRTGWPGKKLLARRARISERACKALTDRLQAKGVLEEVRRGGGRANATVWRLPRFTSKDEVQTSPFEEEEGGSPDFAVPAPGKGEVSEPKGEVLSRKGEAQTSPLSSYSPQEPSSLLSHERIVMNALARQEVTEEEMREVIKEIQRSTKVKIENPTSYLRKVAERGDLVDYLNRVRAAADRRAAHAARQTALPPEPHLEPDRPSTTPEERDSAIAAVRDLLRGTTTRRGAGGPARVVRPRTAPETPPEVERAHATLARHGNALDLMDAARKRLGDQAHRNEVVVLAAELAREERPAPAFA